MTESLPRRPRVLGSPRSVALAKEGVPPEWEPGCGTPRRQRSVGPGGKPRPHGPRRIWIEPFSSDHPRYAGAAVAAARDGRGRPTSSPRCAFRTRERRLELHFRVRSARFGVRGTRRGLRPDRGTPPRPAHGSAGCPNLLQRPRSSRSAREESLIFRASSPCRSRPGAPLQQIRTCPAPDRSRSPTRTTTRPFIPATAPIRAHGLPFPVRKAQ